MENTFFLSTDGRIGEWEKFEKKWEVCWFKKDYEKIQGR